SAAWAMKNARDSAATTDAREVSVDLRVQREQLHPGGARLRDEKAIEGIFVQPGECVDADGMLRRHRQFLEAGFPRGFPHRRRIDGNIHSVERVLDGDLPDGGCRE